MWLWINVWRITAKINKIFTCDLNCHFCSSIDNKPFEYVNACCYHSFHYLFIYYFCGFAPAAVIFINQHTVAVNNVKTQTTRCVGGWSKLAHKKSQDRGNRANATPTPPKTKQKQKIKQTKNKTKQKPKTIWISQHRWKSIC